ncbi:endocuticle structural glycoprotein SgAbd-2-like [Hetaerina americana]|uniref:endocuticle structural glycoprotein SgAbd-2-like n=1 Tax=Hetaerina americana TaxID=62018 RepID=UPI003A7F21D4
MTAVKVTVCFCLLASAARALVPLKPEEALRPPKRLPPPPGPTLPPLPYAVAESPRVGEFSSPLAVQGSPSPVTAQDYPSPVGAQRSPSPFLSSDSPATGPVFRDEVRDDMGQFAVRFSNGDGTFADETGSLISTDDGWEYVIVKKGSYSYISPEGIPITVNYVADQNGFHPQISFS